MPVNLGVRHPTQHTFGTMKKSLLLPLLLVSVHHSSFAGKVKEVDLPETTVIAVKTASGKPSAYAEAFGKLVGFYAQPSAGVKVLFPQQSVSINGANYAAVAVKVPPITSADVESLKLPACHFLSTRYVGNYDGIGPTVEELVNQALSKGKRIAGNCGVRIHHFNSPDNTPIEKLEHVIYVPVSSIKQ